MFDPELYRPKDEVEEWKQRDPIATFTAHLREHDALTDEQLTAIEADVAREVDEAVAFAEAAPWEPVDTLARFVYAEEAPR
jgi:pyruvate dehydrogenase E1 component alpha subunit